MRGGSEYLPRWKRGLPSTEAIAVTITRDYSAPNLDSTSQYLLVDTAIMTEPNETVAGRP